MVIASKQQPKRAISANVPQLVPDSYDSVVIDVQEPTGFAPGDAVDIFYRLTNASGDTFEHNERFFNCAWPSDREKDFFDYLEANGINIYDDWTNLNDFIGCHERLELAKQVKGPNRKVYLNIIGREFVSAPTSMGGQSNEAD